MRVPPPCLFCSIWVFASMVVGVVFLLALSKIALGFLTGTIEWSFAALQHVVLGSLGLLAGLSAWAAIPLGVTLLITLFWMVRNYADRRQWRRLERVREEYEPLRALLKRRGLQVYLGQLEKVRQKLYAERDRMEAMQGLLDEELPRIESRLAELSEQLGKADHEDERHEFRELMRDLAGNSARLRARQGDPEQFDRAQVRVASRLNLLRQRLSELPPEGSDLQAALSDLDSISLMEDLFRNPGHEPLSEQGPGAEEVETPASPESRPPGRERE